MDQSLSLVPWMLAFRRFIVHPPVDARDLFHPSTSLPVLHSHDRVIRPVEMVGYVGYLLGQPLRGVAYVSPEPLISTSNFPSQWGQFTETLDVPYSLIRL